LLFKKQQHFSGAQIALNLWLIDKKQIVINAFIRLRGMNNEKN